MPNVKAKRIKRGSPKRRRGFSQIRAAIQSTSPVMTWRHAGADRNDEVRGLLFEKANSALQQVVSNASRESILDALRALTPFDSLIALTSSEGAIGSATTQIDDPLRAAKARAAKHLSLLLSLEGGPIGVKEVSDRLGISRAAVDKRRNSGTLIGIADRGRSILYPNWQFTDHGILPGLEAALRLLDVSDPWMRMQFFLTHDPDIETSPLNALRKGRLEDVIAAAKRYGHQGGSSERSRAAT